MCFPLSDTATSLSVFQGNDFCGLIVGVLCAGSHEVCDFCHASPLLGFVPASVTSPSSHRCPHLPIFGPFLAGVKATPP